MSIKRIIASSTLALSCAVGALGSASAAQASTSTLPQVQPAIAGANWLASQFNSSGFIPSSTSTTTPQLSSTLNAVLALASAHRHLSVAHKGLAVLATNLATYVPEDGSDGPGQLALLILAAHALGDDPTTFGGSNLVSRLLATQQTTGVDAGMFGTEAQVAGYSAGDYQQGIALAALAAAGITSSSQVTAAVSWLTKQQCPDGGWTSYVSSSNPCDGSPADYEGPDTNSTALAIQGLAAERALPSQVGTQAISFLKSAEDGDGGWGIEPTDKRASFLVTDPDSTALVVQALLALGQAPGSADYVKHGVGPITKLDSFQLSTGTGSGAFYYPGSKSANLFATTEAVPALSGVVLPFSLVVTTSSLPSGTVGATYSATLNASGGVGPFSWRLIDGSSLPRGLNLSPSGTISGTPLAASNTTIVVGVSSPTQTTYPETASATWGVLTLSITPPAPSVEAIAPRHGAMTGGTKVSITGTNLSGATQVVFGSKPARRFVVVSSSLITAISPGGNGIVDVHVTTNGGTSASTAPDRFTYR